MSTVHNNRQISDDQLFLKNNLWILGNGEFIRRGKLENISILHSNSGKNKWELYLASASLLLSRSELNKKKKGEKS